MGEATGHQSVPTSTMVACGAMCCLVWVAFLLALFRADPIGPTSAATPLSSPPGASIRATTQHPGIAAPPRAPDAAGSGSGAALWSAIAASFSAFAAICMLWIQRRNYVEAARPDLVLIDWGRHQEVHGPVETDVVTFAGVKNIGRGPALNVHITAHGEINRCPTYMLPTIRAAIVAVDETVHVQGRIIIAWKNVPDVAAHGKRLGITIPVFYWDSRGYRHETSYRLFCLGAEDSGLMDHIVPGVMLVSRSSIARPVWLIRAQSRVHRAWRFVRYGG